MKLGGEILWFWYCAAAGFPHAPFDYLTLLSEPIGLRIQKFLGLETVDVESNQPPLFLFKPLEPRGVFRGTGVLGVCLEVPACFLQQALRIRQYANQLLADGLFDHALSDVAGTTPGLGPAPSGLGAAIVVVAPAILRVPCQPRTTAGASGSATQKIALRRLTPPLSFGILQNGVRPTIESRLDDLRRYIGDFDPRRRIALDNPTPLLPSQRIEQRGDFGSSPHGTARVGLVRQHAPHGQRMPLPTTEGGYQVSIEPHGNTMHRGSSHKLVKDASNYHCLVGVNLPLARRRAIDIAIDPFASGLGKSARSSSRRLAPSCSLEDLLPLEFGNERTDAQDESPDRSVFEVLRHELEANSHRLGFVKEDPNVVLVSGQTINGVAKNGVDLARTNQVPDTAQARTIEGRTAGCVALTRH